MIQASAYVGVGSLETTFTLINPPENWHNPIWTLGDGTMSREKEPTYRYFMPGVYDVQLSYFLDNADIYPVISEVIQVRVVEPFAPSLEKCYRVGLNNEAQGYGPLEIAGDYWPRPEPMIGALECFDDKDLPRRICFDAHTGTWREISTYNGPEGSGIERAFTDEWYDAELDRGVPEDITWAIDLPEVTGTGENHEIEHLKTFLFFRPVASSYRDTLQINVSLIADGETTTSEALNVSPEGEVLFDVKQLCRRARIRITGTSSQLMFVGHRQYWWVQDHDRGVEFSNTTEVQHREQLASPLLWITRIDSRNRVIDKVDGKRLSGINVASSNNQGAPDEKIGVIAPLGGILNIDKEISLEFGQIMYWGRDVDILYWNFEPVQKVARGTAGGYTLYTGLVNGAGKISLHAARFFDLRIFGFYLNGSTIEYYLKNVQSRSGEAVIPLE